MVSTMASGALGSGVWQYIKINRERSEQNISFIIKCQTKNVFPKDVERTVSWKTMLCVLKLSCIYLFILPHAHENILGKDVYQARIRQNISLKIRKAKKVMK